MSSRQSRQSRIRLKNFLIKTEKIIIHKIKVVNILIANLLQNTFTNDVKYYIMLCISKEEVILKKLKSIKIDNITKKLIVKNKASSKKIFYEGDELTS